MIIESLTLERFKCFESLKLDFKPLTVLSGHNGVGKSSVIQALLALCQSGGGHALKTRGLALSGSLVELGTGWDVLNERSSEDTIRISLGSRTGESNWLFQALPDADVLTALQYPDSNKLLDSLRIRYLSAERVGPKLSYPSSDASVRIKRDLGPQGEFTSHFLASFGGEMQVSPGLHHPAAPTHTLMAQAEAWLATISPGVRLHAEQHRQIGASTLHYSFVRGKDTTRHYKSTNVGYGITYVLPVIVAILAAQPGETLIIENAEAHLHPEGQLMLGRLFALAAVSGVRVLTETHSDHILNGIRIACATNQIAPESVALHFFGPAPHPAVDWQPRLTSPTVDHRGRLSQWPEGFFDTFDKSLAELLSAS